MVYLLLNNRVIDKWMADIVKVAFSQRGLSKYASNFSSILPLNFYPQGKKFEFKSWALIGCKKFVGKIEEKSNKVDIGVNLFENKLPLNPSVDIVLK